MDKSFNDQELSDIMKEIEALEEEFKADASVEAEVEEVEPEVEEVSSPVMDMSEAASVMEELVEMEEEEAIPVAKQEAPILSFDKKPAPVYSGPKVSTPQTSMSFSVSGDLRLDLSFDIGGQIINLEVGEAGLSIQMDGGATFNVPLKKKNAA